VDLPPLDLNAQYPRTKRFSFKHRCALIWCRAFGDEHGKRVRERIEGFIKRNIIRWRGIRIAETDLRDPKS
jgi:hypothetical protein